MTLFKKISFSEDLPLDPDIRWGLGDGLTWLNYLVPTPGYSLAIVYSAPEVKRALVPAPSDPEFRSDSTVWDYLPPDLNPYPDKGDSYHERDYILLENGACIYLYSLDSLPTPDQDSEGSDFHAIWWAGFNSNVKELNKAAQIIARLRKAGQYPALHFIT